MYSNGSWTAAPGVPQQSCGHRLNGVRSYVRTSGSQADCSSSQNESGRQDLRQVREKRSDDCQQRRDLVPLGVCLSANEDSSECSDECDSESKDMCCQQFHESVEAQGSGVCFRTNCCHTFIGSTGVQHRHSSKRTRGTTRSASILYHEAMRQISLRGFRFLGQVITVAHAVTSVKCVVRSHCQSVVACYTDTDRHMYL